MYHGFYNNMNVSTVPNHIRMIYEGSCDTEDWSNDDICNILKFLNITVLQYFFFQKHKKSYRPQTFYLFQMCIMHVSFIFIVKLSV